MSMGGLCLSDQRTGGGLCGQRLLSHFPASQTVKKVPSRGRSEHFSGRLWQGTVPFPSLLLGSYGGNWCERYIDLFANWPDEASVVSMRDAQLILGC